MERASIKKNWELRDYDLSYKKPEPAGAAALAGFLLYMLDNCLVSIYELAFVLKCFGMTGIILAIL